MKRLFSAIMILLISSSSFAIDVKDVKTSDGLKKIDKKIFENQAEFDVTKNKAKSKLNNMTFRRKVYDAGKIKHTDAGSTNYSFCDFAGADIRGVTFKRCNFSFATNMDKAIVDKDTSFVQCNLTGVNPLPSANLILCNTAQLTDQQIEDMFKEK